MPSSVCHATSSSSSLASSSVKAIFDVGALSVMGVHARSFKEVVVKAAM